MTYGYTAIVTLLAVALYFFFATQVAAARGRFGVKLPATTGNPDFERVFRVQQNMVEQLILFLPSLWIFSSTVSPFWGAIIGAVWVAGRVIYSLSYYMAAEKRGPGFLISMAASGILLIGGLIGTLRFLLM